MVYVLLCRPIVKFNTPSEWHVGLYYILCYKLQSGSVLPTFEASKSRSLNARFVNIFKLIWHFVYPSVCPSVTLWYCV